MTFIRATSKASRKGLMKFDGKRLLSYLPPLPPFFLSFTPFVHVSPLEVHLKAAQRHFGAQKKRVVRR
jgi:hypothetical protein